MSQEPVPTSLSWPKRLPALILTPLTSPPPTTTVGEEAPSLSSVGTAPPQATPPAAEGSTQLSGLMGEGWGRGGRDEDRDKGSSPHLCLLASC